jgi:histidinol-phosphatase (PHP family)
MFDYHIHTTRCKHAVGTMEQYVQAAIAAGLDEIGFSDHLPLPMDGPSPFNMLPDELPQYVRDVMDLRLRYPQIPIRLGVEMDYFEGYEDALRRLLATQQFDYVIGSAHFVPLDDGHLRIWDRRSNDKSPAGKRWFCIDSPSEMDEWNRHEVDDVWRAYLRQLGNLARSGLCQIVGHCDLPKKFGFHHSPDLFKDFRRLAGVIAEHGLLCEINTAGLRKPVGEMYPSWEILKILRQAGVGITLGSDSHAPDEVGRDLGMAIDLAKAAGYTHLHKWAAPQRFAPVRIP